MMHHDHEDPHMRRPHFRFRRREGRRFFPFGIFFFGFALLFIGGTAAILYWAFSEYVGVRNIWLLLCGAPFAVILLAVFIVFNLYTRFGKPLRDIFNTIDSVAEGDLSARVPENNSDMFSELFTRFNKMVSELERSDQQRRNLTSDIAHELRTPLHIIQGNLEGILDGVYEAAPEHINNTLEETQLLARLVNDLQTLSLAETGQLPLHPTRFLIADLMDDLTSSFSAQASSLGVDLQTDLSVPNLEFTADYDRLNQALSNLISNSLRHTPRGGKISIHSESSKRVDKYTGKPADGLRITHHDSGAGIPPEDLPFIFDRFWRGDKSRTDRTHSGLGLAITKQIVLAHGGTIDVESKVGEGTTFLIEIKDFGSL